ncbi:MAG: division/cell wall cluster transcriptional repressor MraZ [Burkholderiales bacterium]|nr:division/cell wall cluster transcriptional repressor MraZ [Burkholderiales bacterium]
MFQGTSALKLDGKGRLTVPTRHRDSLLELSQGHLTLTKHPIGCLLVFPRPVWEAFRERVLALPMQADGWRRLFLGSAADVDIDSADRILIPPELRASAGLAHEVSLLGMGQRLELWDSARFAAHEATVMASPMPDAIQGFVF